MTKTVVMRNSYSLFKPKLHVRTPKMNFVGSQWIFLSTLTSLKLAVKSRLVLNSQRSAYLCL